MAGLTRLRLGKWLLLLGGLVAIALPDAISGPIVWMYAAQPALGLHLADVVGFAMLAMGSTLIWIISLIRQWQYTH